MDFEFQEINTMKVTAHLIEIKALLKEKTTSETICMYVGAPWHLKLFRYTCSCTSGYLPHISCVS